ncbi:MAG: hypothetical protein Q8P45_02560 [Candidatus Harrisonbacteria bacterium]|nr:hypothetical protein [Candidatus Harrisonbacteria bacterium]
MKVVSLILVSAFMFAFVAAPLAQAAELTTTQRAQLSSILANLQVSLRNISVQLSADMAETRTMAGQVAQFGSQLQILKNQNIDTESERVTAEAVITNVSAGLGAISGRLTDIQARQQAQANILGQLTAQLKALVDILIE